MPTKKILEELYNVRLMSQKKISEELGIPPSRVSKLMSEYGISLRDKAATAYLQHNKSFAILNTMTSKESILYGIGIGLYWGEGNKVDPYNVRLGNTDPGVIVTFVNFLKHICGVPDKDIRYGLQVFNDTDPVEAKTYWIQKLNCDDSSFHQTVSAIKPQGKGTYKRKNQYGVLQVYVSNKRLKDWLMKEISKYADVAQG